MTERARLWEIQVDSGGETFTKYVTARTRSKARAEAWRAFDDAWSIPFGSFVKVARVRAYDGPPDDCYAYVRRAYGLDVAVGERVSIRGERDGVVAHPGGSTASHVHILFDGMDFTLPVHPSDIVKQRREAVHA